MPERLALIPAIPFTPQSNQCLDAEPASQSAFIAPSGGLHDAPTPSDILCAALAACQESAVRMVANLLGVELELLAVEVTGDVDVRGTMAIDMNVPVGFQAMRCDVRLRAKERTNPELLKRLFAAAERSCVVWQTLPRGVPIQTMFHSKRASE